MKILNSTDSDSIENVSVVVRVTDENGTPVSVTDDPNNLSAKFFVRLSHKENIANVDGTGVVGAKTTAVINWLLIPAAGSAGLQAVGKKYLVGATLKYKFGAEDAVLEVSPDLITVKPLPLLTLDYFLTRDVVADDALTLPIEPAEPFTLGVRVKNNGFATAKNLKIDSAQPKILENEQGLLINFALTGSFLNDAPAANSLLLNFGDVAGKTSKMGRWIMETTLAGKFTEFAARFTHADELGGALTSLLEATKAHFLLRDVRVDLPGRDQVRDFLAEDGDVVRVYESDGADTIVTNRSAEATFAVPPGGSSYRLSFPPTDGFAYVRLPDPNAGTKALGAIMRSDAKAIAPENAWLSKTRNEQTKKWEYFVNFFDVNTTGLYDTQFTVPDNSNKPPVLQFIGDHTVEVGKQVSFLVEASSPSGRLVTIAATPLPAGATLTAQAASAQAPTLSRAIFDWTPAAGSEGSYPIEFSATDGALSAKRTSTITVESAPLPAGPAIPTIDAPLSGAAFVATTETLRVQVPAVPEGVVNQVQYELYADEGLSTLLDSAVLTVQAPPTTAVPPGSTPPVIMLRALWTPAVKLNMNTRYWWRARSFDGTLFSPWINARFNTDWSNAAPSAFNQTLPAPESKVDSLTPVLSWTNASVKYDDAVTYYVTVFKNASMTEVAAQVSGLAADPSGTTSWTVTPALTNLRKYYWRVDAARAPGIQNGASVLSVSAKISAMPRAFTVDTSNRTPSAPLLVGPLGGAIGGANAALSVQQSSDPEADLLTYVFEIDRVKTFDSAAKRGSGQLLAGSGNVTWTTPSLEQNKRYWWRAKAQDGRSESAWTTGEFTLSDANDAPSVPLLKNPGNGAWTALVQPSLELTAAKDPEGDAVRYQFEVYRDAGLTRKVADGTSDFPSLIAPAQLASKAWHWWRARSIDAQGATSAWSAPASFYVSAGTAQEPTIALTAPAVASVPVTVVGTGTAPALKVATIRWEGADLNRQASVSLYYSSSRFGYAGTQIVGGLQQAAGSGSGSYEWDVTGMAPGVYYIYAVTFDTRGTAKAYAPGAVVIPNATQTGALQASGPGVYYEAFASVVTMTWNGASGKPLAMPLLGNGQRSNLVTRASAASGNIATTVVVPYLCSKPVQTASFPLQLGPVMTEDLNFAGRAFSGASTGIVGAASSNAGNETLRVCDIRILSEKKVNATMSDYTISARLSTVGLGLTSAVATPIPTMAGLWITTAASGKLTFGAISAGESGATDSVVVVRASTGTLGIPVLGGALKWSVQVTR